MEHRISPTMWIVKKAYRGKRKPSDDPVPPGPTDKNRLIPIAGRVIWR